MHSNEIIRAIRRKHGMTQAEFSDFLGIPQHIVMQWEGDIYSPPMYVASLIGRIFDLSEGATCSCDKRD